MAKQVVAWKKETAKLQKRYERKSLNQKEREPSYTTKKEYPKLGHQKRQGDHVLHWTSNTATIFINREGFNQKFECLENMSVRKHKTKIGMEYHILFGREQDIDYIKDVFLAYTFLA